MTINITDFTNRGLFSDYVLLERMQYPDGWESNCEDALHKIKTLYGKEITFLEVYNEAQTESNFIRPVLDILGWSFEPQIKFHHRGRNKLPDYALFSSEKNKALATSTKSDRTEPCNNRYFELTSAICEAKYWERALDKKKADKNREDPADAASSPHFQIIDYLDCSNVGWGVLTNGRKWRLYYSGTNMSEINYFEVDLIDLLNENSIDSFKWFYLFFCACSFTPRDSVTCFLESLRKESRDFAGAIEDRLKTRVFERVFPILAEGFYQSFLDATSYSGDTSKKQLELIYNSTVLLLFRLLFLLYAEARDLIAVDNSINYHGISLRKIVDSIAIKLSNNRAFGKRSTSLWSLLKDLFNVINLGDPALAVPRYNGGLFDSNGMEDPDLKPCANFLDKFSISDHYFSQALVFLVSDSESIDLTRHLNLIDYKDLSVRHLGSVYEGLLEFRLCVAKAHLIKGTKKGKPIWKKTSSADLAYVKKGSLYLTNDKEERRATGSYYTPDYIVHYMVHKVLSPILYKLDDDSSSPPDIGKGYPPLSSIDFPDNLAAEIKSDHPIKQSLGEKCSESKNNFLIDQCDPIIEVLSLRILDPAMGSGHFLVTALDFLTKHIVGMLVKYPDSKVIELIEKDRINITNSLIKQGIEPSEESLTDEVLLKRMILKRNLFGVDNNPLAVELSKLSLWLHAFTAGAPLSFLDYHLKCGDSLVGSSISDISRYTQAKGDLFTLSLDSINEAVESLLNVCELSDASFEDVETSHFEYNKAMQVTKGYKAIFDCYIAEMFGFKDAHLLLNSGITLGVKGFADPGNKLTRKDLKLLDSIKDAAFHKRFFHWEIEFPEVFFLRCEDKVVRRNSPAFDAIIGNPPYDVLSKKSNDDFLFFKKYINHHSALSYCAIGKINYYELFFMRFVAFVGSNTGFSFILPMAILGDYYSSLLRKQWLETTFFSEVHAFPQKDDIHKRVFPDAKLPTAIVTTNGDSSNNGRVVVHPGRTFEDISKEYRCDFNRIKSLDSVLFSIPLARERDLLLAQELLDTNKYQQFCKIALCHQGEVNETNHKDLLSTTADGEPVLRGGNIQQYRLLPKPKQGTQLYLNKQMFMKSTNDETRVNHHQKRRLVFQRNSALDNYRRLIACIAPPGKFCFDSVNYIVTAEVDMYAILALFNSRLFEWKFRLTSTNNHVNIYEIDALPIPLYDNSIDLRPSRINVITRITDKLKSELLSYSVIEEFDVLWPELIPKAEKQAVPVKLTDGDLILSLISDLAKYIERLHCDAQSIWKDIETSFENAGVDPKSLGSIAVTQGLVKKVQQARTSKRKTPQQQRLLVHANLTEKAFACSIDELHSDQSHVYSFTDLPKIGTKCFKWLTVLRGVDPTLLDSALKSSSVLIENLTILLAQIGHNDWYSVSTLDRNNVEPVSISAMWLIDQLLYRFYSLSISDIETIETSFNN